MSTKPSWFDSKNLAKHDVRHPPNPTQPNPGHILVYEIPNELFCPLRGVWWPTFGHFSMAAPISLNRSWRAVKQSVGISWRGNWAEQSVTKPKTGSHRKMKAEHIEFSMSLKLALENYQKIWQHLHCEIFECSVPYHLGTQSLIYGLEFREGGGKLSTHLEISQSYSAWDHSSITLCHAEEELALFCSKRLHTSGENWVHFGWCFEQSVGIQPKGQVKEGNRKDFSSRY